MRELGFSSFKWYEQDPWFLCLPPSRKINGKEISKTCMIWSQDSTQVPHQRTKILRYMKQTIQHLHNKIITQCSQGNRPVEKRDTKLGQV